MHRVAAVLEVARALAVRLAPGRGGIMVAFFDGEINAAGSRNLADELRDDGGNPLVINLDGAGRLNATASVEAAGPAGDAIRALDRAERASRIPLKVAAVASDNRRFAAAGFGAVESDTTARPARLPVTRRTRDSGKGQLPNGLCRKRSHPSPPPRLL
jgi:hypothetical protein